MGNKKRGGKGKKKKIANKPADSLPLDVLVHKTYDTSTPIPGYVPNLIKLQHSVAGKGRGFVASTKIDAGTLIHRSYGYICSPSIKREPFEGVPQDKQMSVHLLEQLVEKLEDTSYPTPKLHKSMKNIVMNELQPQNLEEWQGKQTSESELIAELFCKATNRPLDQKDSFARLGLVAVVNSHQIQYEFGQYVSEDWGIFPSASFINHSCWPNCNAFYSSKHNEFWIQTIQEIQPGEELTINYVSLYLPRKERNQKLELQYEFSCKCEKCLRVEANSTLNRIDEYLEAFNCPQDSCQGVFLWLKDSSGEIKGLECKQCHFKSSELVNEYFDIEQEVKQLVSCIWSDHGSSLSLSDVKRRLEEAEAKINKYLHPYNSYSFQVKMARAKFHKYAATIDEAGQGTSKEEIQRRTENLEKLLSSLQAVNRFCVLIYPKYHPQRAHILLDMGNVCSVLDRAEEGKKLIQQGLAILNVCRGSTIAKDQLRQLFATGH